MPLGLGASLSKASIVTPGVVTDGLVMKHMYPAGAVQPLSDGAAYFDSANDYIDLGTQANTGDDISFSAWVYFTDTGVQPIINFGDFLVKFSDDTTFRVWADQSDGGSSAAIPYLLNRWGHIAAVVDDTNISMYYDGVLKETDAVADGLSTDSIGSTIGKESSSYFGGYMCNLGLWSRVLTQAEIKSIMFKQYADLTTSEKTSLVSFWNLDEAYDSVVFDNHHGGGETLGPELVTGWTNNDFTSLTSSGSDITSAIGDGSANHDLYSNTLNITAGDTFKITFTLGGNPGSSLDFRLSPHSHLGSADYDTSALSVGTYTYYITSGITDSTSFFGFRSANQACDFSVTNFSVKKINGNPGELK